MERNFQNSNDYPLTSSLENKANMLTDNFLNTSRN